MKHSYIFKLRLRSHFNKGKGSKGCCLAKPSLNQSIHCEPCWYYGNLTTSTEYSAISYKRAGWNTIVLTHTELHEHTLCYSLFYLRSSTGDGADFLSACRHPV